MLSRQRGYTVIELLIFCAMLCAIPIGGYILYLLISILQKFAA